MIYFWYGMFTVILIAGGWGLIGIESAFVAAVVVALIIRHH